MYDTIPLPRKTGVNSFFFLCLKYTYLLATGFWVATSRSLFPYSRGQWYPHSNYFSDFVKQNIWILCITLELLRTSKHSPMLPQCIILIKNNNSWFIWISVLYAIHKRQIERQTRIIQVKIKNNNNSPCIFCVHMFVCTCLCVCAWVWACVFSKIESWFPSSWTGPFKSPRLFHWYIGRSIIKQSYGFTC